MTEDASDRSQWIKPMSEASPSRAETLRQSLIAKLADTMDPDTAAAFVAEAFAETDAEISNLRESLAQKDKDLQALRAVLQATAVLLHDLSRAGGRFDSPP